MININYKDEVYSYVSIRSDYSINILYSICVGVFDYEDNNKPTWRQWAVGGVSGGRGKWVKLNREHIITLWLDYLFSSFPFYLFLLCYLFLINDRWVVLIILQKPKTISQIFDTSQRRTFDDRRREWNKRFSFRSRFPEKKFLTFPGKSLFIQQVSKRISIFCHFLALPFISL